MRPHHTGLRTSGEAWSDDQLCLDTRAGTVNQGLASPLSFNREPRQLLGDRGADGRCRSQVMSGFSFLDRRRDALDPKLKALLTMFRESIQENRQQAAYLIPRNEDEKKHKAWLEGRASAYANAAQWLGKIIE